MKRIIGILLVIMTLCLIAMSAAAAPVGPEITLEPQSPNYPEYSVAIYTVKATGTNLTATWYISYEGKTYNASAIGGTMQPWEAYAGELYGAKKLDANTFAFVFEGIEHGLNGSQIWCVIEDGHYSVTSQKAYIQMGNPATPPEILSIPAKITVAQGEAAEIRCVARSNDQSQLGYIWYETSTGKLEDIQAMDRGTELGDFIICDTSKTGTRYYVCAVNTSNGGITYSSVVPVTVTAAAATVEPTIQTKSLPEATAGENYSAQIKCNDPKAEFAVYYNPGKANDFNKTGLNLSADGKITGTPTAPGSYQFCICAAGAGGEDYMVYTLVVKEAPITTEPATEPDTEPSTEPTTEPVETVISTEPTEITPTETQSTTEPTVNTNNKNDSAGISPWIVVLVGLIAAGAGVGVALILTKKKSK